MATQTTTLTTTYVRYVRRVTRDELLKISRLVDASNDIVYLTL